MFPDVVLSRTPQIPRQEYTSEHLFYRTASCGFCQISVIFLKREKKQKQLFILPMCLIRLKSCNCIKIVKIVFSHNFAKKLLVSFKFCNIKYRSSHQRFSIKKENTCARASFLRTFFTEHLCSHLSTSDCFSNTKTTSLAFT